MIELDEELGMADGEEVEILIRSTKAPRPWGDGLKQSAGSLAGSWTKEDDHILEHIQEERKLSKQREIPE